MKSKVFIFLLLFLVLSSFFSKPILIITSANSNYLEAEWINRYNELVLSSISDLLIFEVIYEPKLTSKLNYYYEKDVFIYSENILRSYSADYVLFHSIMKLTNFEYSLHLQIVNTQTKEVVISETYIIYRQQKIDESIQDFSLKISEFDSKYNLFTEQKRSSLIWLLIPVGFLIGVGLGALIISLGR